MSAGNHLIGLGIDAGGTRTRWALADAHGDILAEGHVAGLTALQMATDPGREHFRETLATLAQDVLAVRTPMRACAGVTGFTEGGEGIRRAIAGALKLDPAHVTLKSDIEIACLDLFAPGEGYVVYAGTGTVAAFVDAAGEFHRAGGRGAILDDAGGGFWIAVEALRHVWREEDVAPGAWKKSPMAVELFNRLGGSDWAKSREFVYQSERGEIGKLARAVAASAARDPVAMGILGCAGGELGRLGCAMISRFGRRPIALAGRVAELHPVIEQTMRMVLPPGTDLKVRTSEAHVAAARIAAK